jgi:hypothetical protein
MANPVIALQDASLELLVGANESLRWEVLDGGPRPDYKELIGETICCNLGKLQNKNGGQEASATGEVVTNSGNSLFCFNRNK